MTETETGWTKEFPRRGDWYVCGWYWMRRLSNHALAVISVNQHGFYWDTGRLTPSHLKDVSGDYEWLGPISPSDFEQLTRLREAVEAARTWICRVSNQYILGTDDPHEVLVKLRKALEPELAQRHTGGEQS